MHYEAEIKIVRRDPGVLAADFKAVCDLLERRKVERAVSQAVKAAERIAMDAA